MKRKVGYHEDIDAVSISYDGSEGEIIEIEGLRIMLPKCPKKTDVYKRSNKKEEQYFQRQELPIGFNKSNYKIFDSYIESQFEIKEKGFWFMNNGEPEYITGAHWFLLQWCKGDAEPSAIYPKGEFYYFTKAQQKLAYYMEASWVDDRSAGIAFTKPRRFGATGFGLAFFLSKGVTKKNGKFGITSMKESEAKKAFERLAHIFRNLPPFFQPANKGVTKEGLQFKNPEKRTSTRVKAVEYEDDLNTEFDYQATGVKAYDSRALTGYLADEISKYPQETNCVTHWSSVRKTMTKGSKITGKTFMLTTIEDYRGVDDPYENGAGSGDRFKYIYDGSKCSERNANGRTVSGLYKIFISCYEHYEGKIDMYGYPILESSEDGVINAEGEVVKIGIKDFIENEINAIPNIQDRYNELRKTPRTEADLWRVVGSDSMFNQVKLNQQYEYNIRNIDDGIVRGNFVWRNGEPDTVVDFIPTEAGRFYVKWLPKEQDRNKFTTSSRIKYPANEGIGVFGVDPYKIDQSVGGSKGAAHGFSKLNAMGAPCDDFFLEYIDKPPIRELFFEDVIMALVFYGMPALIESNVPEILIEMYKRGYTGYVMRRPDKKLKELTAWEKKYGGIPSNGAGFIKTHAACIQSYIETRIGVATDDKYRSIGEFGKMSFNRTLNDWSQFDISNRTKYDATISSGLALFASQKSGIQDKEVKIVKSPIQLYRRTGDSWNKF